MDNMSDQDQSNNHNIAIMNKLADIQTSLAVNTNETANTKLLVAKMELVVGEISKQTKETNGRTSKLEAWSIDAQKIIDSTSTLALQTAKSLNTSETKINNTIKILLWVWPAVFALASLVMWYKAHDIARDVLNDTLESGELQNYDKIIIENNE